MDAKPPPAPKPEKTEPIIAEPPQYNEEQMELLTKIFNTFDFEKTGHVGLDVIPTTLTTLGVKLKQAEMQALIKEIDADGSGKIEFKEYIALAMRYIEPEDDFSKLYNELRQVFMVFDKGNKGFLTLDEFKEIVKEIEPELPAAELDAIVEEVDADGSGRIEFEEFLQVMRGDDERGTE